MMTIQVQKQKRLFFFLLAITIVITESYGLIFMHDDGLTITNWAVELLNAFREGRSRDWAIYLSQHGLPSNYNVLVNVANAVWLLPVYLLDTITHMDLGGFAFCAWYKQLLLLITLAGSFYLRKLLLFYELDENYANVIALLYLLNPCMVLGNFAMGQTDCVTVSFLIMFAYYLSQDSMIKAMFWLSAAAAVKDFALLFVVLPAACLLIANTKVRELITYLGVYIVLPVISFFLSHFYFRDYARLSKEIESEKWNHISHLFMFEIVVASAFLIVYSVVLFLNLRKSYRHEVEKRDYYISVFFVVSAFTVFSVLNPQWLVYQLVVLCLGVVIYREFLSEVVLLLMFGMGTVLYIIGMFQGNVDIVATIFGILPKISNWEFNGLTWMNFIDDHWPKYTTYVRYIGKSLMDAAVLLSGYFIIKSESSALEYEENNLKKNGYMGYGAVAVMMVFHFMFLAGTIYMGGK